MTIYRALIISDNPFERDCRGNTSEDSTTVGGAC